jgi:hypothetical protein
LLTPATWAEEGAGVITERDDVESHALAVRGWSLCSISSHSGRDRKAIRRYVARTPRRRHKRAPTCLEPRRGSIEARFADDPHLEATALIRELVDARPRGSYPTLVRDCGGCSCGRCLSSADTTAASK